MSNYVLKYKRGEEVKYLSHLDFMRFFQRVLRRAGLPMSFSKGFNPHPIMTVAMPLSVGVTADGELIKIGLEADYDGDDLMKVINYSLPKGFEIVAAKKLSDKKEIDFTALNRADYICRCELCGSVVPDVKEFLANKELLVMKKTKSGTKEEDIRPHIHKLKIIPGENNEIIIKMRVDAGNNYNLKPDTVIEALKKYTDGFDVDFYNVHRCALLAVNKELI